MKLLVQQFLENHSFKELQEQHGVYASFSKSGHKFSLNYDQIEANESDPLAQECRGLILALEDGDAIAGIATADGRINRDNVCPGGTTILAYPMRRFFNYGQGSAAPINWSDPSLTILEKLDGTLCIVYFDPFTDQWCVATRSVPEADLMMDNGIFTFRSLFEKALSETTSISFKSFVTNLSKSHTYCFELTTPYNRIVVEYKKCGITLLAVRDLSSHQEVSPNRCEVANVVPVVQAHGYNNIDELLNWVSSLNPMEHEGVVVRDSNFNRIKVKNAAYVAYNKIRDTLATSSRNCVELILAEKDDDVIPMLPEEIVKNLQHIKLGIQRAFKAYDEAFQEALKEANTTNPGDKKTFAILVTQSKRGMWHGPFFHMYDGRSSSMKDFVQKNKKSGTWPDSFLDKILELSNSYNQT